MRNRWNILVWSIALLGFIITASSAQAQDNDTIPTRFTPTKLDSTKRADLREILKSYNFSDRKIELIQENRLLTRKDIPFIPGITSSDRKRLLLIRRLLLVSGDTKIHKLLRAERLQSPFSLAKQFSRAKFLQLDTSIPLEERNRAYSNSEMLNDRVNRWMTSDILGRASYRDILKGLDLDRPQETEDNDVKDWYESLLPDDCTGCDENSDLFSPAVYLIYLLDFLNESFGETLDSPEKIRDLFYTNFEELPVDQNLSESGSYVMYTNQILENYYSVQFLNDGIIHSKAVSNNQKTSKQERIYALFSSVDVPYPDLMKDQFEDYVSAFGTSRRRVKFIQGGNNDLLIDKFLKELEITRAEFDAINIDAVSYRNLVEVKDALKAYYNRKMDAVVRQEMLADIDDEYRVDFLKAYRITIQDEIDGLLLDKLNSSTSYSEQQFNTYRSQAAMCVKLGLECDSLGLSDREEEYPLYPIKELYRKYAEFFPDLSDYANPDEFAAGKFNQLRSSLEALYLEEELLHVDTSAIAVEEATDSLSLRIKRRVEERLYTEDEFDRQLYILDSLILKFALNDSANIDTFNIEVAKRAEEQWQIACNKAEIGFQEKLRANLLALIDARDDSLDLNQPKAMEALADTLLIDLTITEASRTTPFAFALSRIHTFVQKARLGVFRSRFPSLAEADEERWRWLKSYGLWHAAMMVHLYPENFLFPKVRSDYTPQFMEIIEKYQDKYINDYDNVFDEYFQEIIKVPLLERLITDDSIVYFIGVSDIDNKVYYAALDSNNNWKDWRSIDQSENSSDIQINKDLLLSVRSNDMVYFFGITPQLNGRLKLLFKSIKLKNSELLAVSNGWQEIGLLSPETKLSDLLHRDNKNSLCALLSTNNTITDSVKIVYKHWNHSNSIREAYTLYQYTMVFEGGEFSNMLISKEIGGYNVGSIRRIESDHHTNTFALVYSQDGNIRYKLSFKDNLPVEISNPHILGPNKNYSLTRRNGNYLFYTKNGKSYRKSFLKRGENYELSLFQQKIFDVEVVVERPLSHRGKRIFVLDDKIYKAQVDQSDIDLNYNNSNFQNPYVFVPYKNRQYYELSSSSRSTASRNNDPRRKYTDEYQFHLPLWLSGKLNEENRFEEAFEVLSRVYDPMEMSEEDRIKYPGFFDAREEAVWGQISADPFDPFSMAEGDKTKYLLQVKYKHVENLLDWADYLFSLDSPESVNRARELYELAGSVLNLTNFPEANCALAWIDYNDQPIEVRNFIDELKSRGGCDAFISAVNNIIESESPKSVKLLKLKQLNVREICDRSNGLISNLKKKVEENRAPRAEISAYEQRVLDMLSASSGQDGLVTLDLGTNRMGLELKPFCIPRNPLMNLYKFRIESNLQKIRTNRNFAGYQRNLQFYATPVDPAKLVRAAARGNLDFEDYIPTSPPPVYRYSFLLERARYLTEQAKSLENLLLNTFKELDNETYTYNRAKQDLALERANVSLQRLRVNEANTSIRQAQKQRERVDKQFNYYEGLLEEGISDLEKTVLIKNYAIAAAYAAAATGAGLSIIASDKALEFALKGESYLSAALSTQAAYQRRTSEWQFQKGLAEIDQKIAEIGIDLAEGRRDIVEKEEEISEIRQQHAEDNIEFLNDEKFTNREFYTWMKKELKKLYRHTYNQAFATALAAQKALEFERQTALDFIQYDYWDDEREGILASQRLLNTLNNLEQHRLSTAIRKKEITKTFSLAQKVPVAFERFRNTGVLDFEILEEWFDREYPGHYMRLIKDVNVSVFALVPPVEGIKATLSNPGISRTVVGAPFEESTIILRSPESIAISGANNDTGLFTLAPNDPMLLPFEGSGIATTWTLEMPKGANPFDYNTIADVIFTIRYTAKEDRGYRDKLLESWAQDEFGYVRTSSSRAFSIRNEFPDQWYHLQTPIVGMDSLDYFYPVKDKIREERKYQAPYTIVLDLQKNDFLHNEENKRISKVTLVARYAQGYFPDENTSIPLKMAFYPAGGFKQNTENISISSFANSTQNYNGLSPFGKWAFRLDVEDKSNPFFYPIQFGSRVNQLDLSNLEDLILMIEYRAKVHYNR